MHLFIWFLLFLFFISRNYTNTNFDCLSNTRFWMMTKFDTFLRQKRGIYLSLVFDRFLSIDIKCWQSASINIVWCQKKPILDPIHLVRKISLKKRRLKPENYSTKDQLILYKFFYSNKLFHFLFIKLSTVTLATRSASTRSYSTRWACFCAACALVSFPFSSQTTRWPWFWWY
jgi:hypothetical protein